MKIPLAPKASAMKTSDPRRTPESKYTSKFFPTACAIGYRVSIEDNVRSICRPPWLETTIPSAPYSVQSTASLTVLIPFITKGRLVSDLSQSNLSQVNPWYSSGLKSAKSGAMISVLLTNSGLSLKLPLYNSGLRLKLFLRSFSLGAEVGPSTVRQIAE